MKKTLSVLLSLIMLFSVVAGVNVTADAAVTTRETVINSNVAKIKNYIKNNGFVNGNGNYTIQSYDYSDSYDYYFLMIVDSSTDNLEFRLNTYDSSANELFSVLKLDLSSPTEKIKYVETYNFDGVNEYSVLGGHAYVSQNYHDEADNVAFYIDYNDTSIDEDTAINMFRATNRYAFCVWNEMLAQKMNLNLGAVGFVKYCTSHKFNGGEITKKPTPTATGVKTFTCTLCGSTKTQAVAKCAKYANPMTATGRTVAVKLAKLKKKKKISVAAKKAITIGNAQGAVTCKKVKGSKKITVAQKNGALTVKKGLKKGKYKVVINVTAAGNSTYKPVTKQVTVIVKVK